jgi:hypothetical protein
MMASLLLLPAGRPPLLSVDLGKESRFPSPPLPSVEVDLDGRAGRFTTLLAQVK